MRSKSKDKEKETERIIEGKITKDENELNCHFLLATLVNLIEQLKHH